ncbi:adenylyltransferase/cytidyltransferase family protein [Pseudomonas sp. NPDC089530]|uniref:adenylyltransferase/cytidyltransferase family protein n=1 Tax=Pseudomonas sp. NPDC089530 TaxID=3390651 RepID=UPI003CFEDF34
MIETLEAIKSKHLEKTCKIGYTSGVFDLLHMGHKNFISSCQKQCDILIIGVDSDQRVKEQKGDQRPIQHQNVRITEVSRLNEYTFLKNADSHFYIANFKVDIIFLSSDRSQKIKKLKQCYPSKEIVMIPYTKNISTTLLISQPVMPV